ncbi:ATP-dependent RNA helicase HrpA [Fibrobacter sp. UWB5]|uniref:ATP-dependent RNA helicase HrpA n=1 Tax=Fibrobacter sp. UWB5 TaxID=1964360 RepID=UPI000B5276EE|nr:ATP-dependent RNA helicase HrpA [Fibrobacter sp. UWB5]OWV10299.1 ATP-dependent RNA helicase HrpA [Fibrobacter sp. UWB5]
MSLKIDYPELPVVEHREEFFEMLEKHQVVIVKADTGSGKSTQLPKFLLEWFANSSEKTQSFKIGVTEPRRLAAISIADRLREELKDETLVSTKIRFWEQGQSDAPIKVMTDGILLQEFRRDRLFRQYSAVVIDEAHERSLNIDILLGIFKTVLQARPEFKLIVASATLDAKLFEEFYDNSCVLEAEGRMYPVDIEYFFDGSAAERAALDISGKGDSGLLDEARDAILDLESRHRDHLLCFLPTERDIQDLAGELAHELDSATFDVLPLFGRMSPEEQRRIFKNSGKTRVVLATNIAETSLTIPGIAYVVDTGMARISRYNAQSRIQGLPVEEISKASARQRTGRAGRVKPGVCIRLYSPEEFEKRDEFTEPEIRRSNLANVVLQLRSLGLELENFPFLQSPPHSAFRGAYKTLFELGALTADNSSGHVTKLGREMTRLPMDVALSAVLLRAREAGVLQPALIVCSALSIQDPRVVPGEEPERTRIRQLHRKFAGHKSDFLTFISMWNAFCAEWDGKSWNKLRKFCDKFSMHFLRCREWIDLYEQFGRILDVKFDKRECPLESFHADNLHIALLSGFLGGVARRDIENGCYRLVSGRETHVFPGSDLYGKSVEWLFSAEVRETSRIFLNKGAEIKPEWIMQVAEPFCTRRWFMPTWNQERGFVEAVEEVSFRGLVISRGHRVDYARVNPDECAEIFWREAVVLGQMARPFAFMTHNERVVEDLHGLEARKRQFGLAPSEDALVDYYVRIAPRVNSIKTLKDYIREHTDQFLKFDAKFWLDQNESGVSYTDSGFSNRAFDALAKGDKKKGPKPQEPQLGGSLEQFRIECLDGSSRMVVGEMVFDATKEYDGITLDLPYDLIPQVTPAKLALSIHQWREWMIESIVREMPKAAKKQLENRRTFIDDAFCDRLKATPHKSPMVSLYEVFAGIKQLDCDIPTVTPEKENHLRLHAKIFKTGFPEKFACEINPEWGSFNLFAAVRPIVVTFGIDFALGDMRFGWRLGESALMTPAESAFWQNFRKRVEGRANSSVDATAPETSEAAAQALIADRLNLLETGGLYSDGFKTALKAWALKSLVADHLDANRCVRFTGLEFSRGKKINDFKNLAATSRSEDDEVRLALVRATYESALLGAEVFVKYWDILREFSVAMRQGGDHARDAIAALTAGHKFIVKIIELYSPDGPENTLFERISVLAGALASQISALASQIGAPEGQNSRISVVTPQSADRPDLSVKALREKFRPFLKARFMKDHELKNARDLLSKMERLSQDEPEYPELYLQACAMLEGFEVLKFKRKGDDSEDVIEVDALAKLKGRFGRL